MSPVAFLKDLLSRGMPLDMAIEAAEAFEAQVRLSESEILGARRAKDRDRKRAAKLAQLSADSTENAENAETLSPSPPPQTPPPRPHTRGDIYTPARGTDFDAFWEAYPAKVGKQAAQRAWAKAKGRPPLGEILAAIDAYRRAKPPDRDWCHPTTWLSQGRWADEHPAPTGPRNDRHPSRTAKSDHLDAVARAMVAACDRPEGERGRHSPEPGFEGGGGGFASAA